MSEGGRELGMGSSIPGSHQIECWQHSQDHSILITNAIWTYTCIFSCNVKLASWYSLVISIVCYKSSATRPHRIFPCAYFEPSVLFCTDLNQETGHKIFIWQTGRAIFISRDMETCVSIPGLSSIFKIDEEEMAAAINILCMDLTSLMSISPAKKCMQS